MKLRIFMHLMPWEIDAALSVSDKLRRSSYYLQKGDDVRLDFILNLSSAIIDWDKSKLDKQFFIDKFNSLEELNNWSDYNTRIYEGNEIWGHLDAFRDVVNDDYECDAYVSLAPNVSFHSSLLFYVFYPSLSFIFLHLKIYCDIHTKVQSTKSVGIDKTSALSNKYFVNCLYA